MFSNRPGVSLTGQGYFDFFLKAKVDSQELVGDQVPLIFFAFVFHDEMIE